MPRPNRLSTAASYAEIFFAHNGAGPYQCVWCRTDVEFNDVVVHHIDRDRSNNNPNNLAPCHWDCHGQIHAEERRQKAKETWAKRRTDPDAMKRHLTAMQDPDRCARIGESTKQRLQDPTEREKVRSASNARWSKPGSRDRHADHLRSRNFSGLGLHKRWHVNRGIVQEGCEFCHGSTI